MLFLLRASEHTRRQSNGRHASLHSLPLAGTLAMPAGAGERLSAAVALVFLLQLAPAFCKTTIEPCSASDACTALLSYTLYTDLKVSELSTLFSVDPLSLLAANSLDFTAPGAVTRILPSGVSLRIPTSCRCSDGVRKAAAARYTARPGDTPSRIAVTVFAGLASADQIMTANALPGTDPEAPLDPGDQLVVPLPCVCFNSSDNSVPAVYLSYVVAEGDSVAGIAGRFQTTATDLMNANSLGSPALYPGDIIAIPLPACASTFPSFASDSGLLVANGTYALTANHCVQCTCGPRNLDLYCSPASLPVSCSSMQCSNSSIMLGNVTLQQSSAGCSVTSCSYGGFVNGSISTALSTTLQPRCPGPRQFSPLIQIPEGMPDSDFAPAFSPAPGEAGGVMPSSGSSIPGSFALPAVSPASGPAGSVSSMPVTAQSVSPGHILGLLALPLVFNLQI